MPQVSLCLMEGVKLLWKSRCRIHGLRLSPATGSPDNSQDQTVLTPLTHTLIYMPPRKRNYSPDELRLLAHSRNESIHGHFATQLRARNTENTNFVPEPKPKQDEIDILMASQIDWLNPDLYTYPPKKTKPAPPKPRPKPIQTRLQPLPGQSLPPLFFSPFSQPDDYTGPTPSAPHSETTATPYDDPTVPSPKQHSIPKWFHSEPASQSPRPNAHARTPTATKPAPLSKKPRPKPKPKTPTSVPAWCSPAPRPDPTD